MSEIISRERINKAVQDADMFDLCKSLGIQRIGKKLYRCPMNKNHARGDSHASFYVNMLAKTFKCFVCQEDPLNKNVKGWSGDAIYLVMSIKKCGFPNAIEYLEKTNAASAKSKKERGIDQTATERGAILESFVDNKLFAPIYSLLWSTGRPVTEFQEIVDKFGALGISKDTLSRLNVVYLNDLKRSVNAVANKYQDITVLIDSGVLYIDNSFKFENHRILLPFYVGNSIVNLQGWILGDGGRQVEFSNINNGMPALFNEDKLRTLPSDEKVALVDDTFEAMSYMELFSDRLVVASSSEKYFMDEWYSLFEGHPLEIIPRTKSAAKAQEHAKIIKGKGVLKKFEVVSLSKLNANSINQVLRNELKKKRGET